MENDRYLNTAAVSALTTLSRATIDRKVASGEMPRPVYISQRRKAWREVRDPCLDGRARGGVMTKSRRLGQGDGVDFPPASGLSKSSRKALKLQRDSVCFVIAWHVVRGTLYAAVDPEAHHVEGEIQERRFPAFATPFRSVEQAEAALIAAGGELIGNRRGR